MTEQDIDKEIDSSDLFVILCGLDTGDRRQVNREVRRALERRSRGLLKILPVLLQARASIPNGIDFAIQAPFLTTIFPEVARARIATVAFSAVLLTAAVSFSVMWLTGFNLQRYVHYRVLSGPVAEHAEKGASGQPGKFVRDAYGEVWLQRFEAGMLILPTAEEKFTFHDGDRSFSNSLFILHVTGTDNAAQERGEWFLQRRPPTRGDFYDARDFADFARNVRSEWETLLRWQPSSGLKIDEIIAMFSPHSESSPVNLCGALALAYAKYRLDRYLGRPVEHQFDGTMLLRAYSDGYVLTGLPTPETDVPNGSVLPRRPVASYILRQTDQPDVIRRDERIIAGGVEIYERGTWTEVTYVSPWERITRPSDNFVRDLPPNDPRRAM